MTIGIVVRGPQAGTALVNSLSAIESIAEGSIGGFVSFVVLDKDHTPTFYKCQAGGITSLFACENKSDLPIELMNATRAALISSGPNRPEPLHRFLAWDDKGNLVSGHRFPHMQTKQNIPLNQQALSILQMYGSDEHRLDELIEQNPDLDAGLVTMDAHGCIYQSNTARVAARGDTASRNMQTPEYAYSITLNSILPPDPIAEILAVKLQRRLELDRRPVLHVTTDSPISNSNVKSVEIDDTGRVVNINTPERHWFSPEHEGALIETGTIVLRDSVTIGKVHEEPYVISRNGKIIALSGKQNVSLRYAAL